MEWDCGFGVIIDTDDQTMRLGDLSGGWFFVFKEAMEKQWENPDCEPAIFVKGFSENGEVSYTHIMPSGMRSGKEVYSPESRIYPINVKSLDWDL